MNSILPLLAGLFARKSEKSGHNSVSHLLHFVTDTIKNEVSGLVLKISLALVASGVLIFSLIMIGRNVHESLLLYDNGQLMSGIFFGLVSAACAAGLFFLFRDKSPLPEMETLSHEDTASHMAEKIFLNFLDGLNKGMAEAPTKSEKVVIVEDGESELRDIKINDYRYSEVVH